MIKPKTFLRVLPRTGEVIRAILAMRNQEILTTPEHLRLCADWLLLSQSVDKSGGYAASYSLITGLRHAYIETTGYIVPTMFDLAVALNDARCRESALRAGEWLLTVQHQNGAFTDIDSREPQVFDTGQVMMGLNRLYRETKDARYFEATRRAADWLAKVQDADGSWATMGYYRGQPACYHTRVAAAVMETSQLTREEKHRDCAAKNLRWAASRRQSSGFFLNSELSPGANPVLHTMVYVLEGFLMAYQFTGENEWLEILLRSAEPLRRINLERDMVLRSQYDADLSVTNPEKCIPGLAQWAGVCLHLHKITDDDDWLEAAQLSVYYLKSKQLRGKGILHGALPASVPIWGYYHPMMFPNWGVKFFADALLLYAPHNIPVWQEQEIWVKKCFELQLDGGGWQRCANKLGLGDQIILGEIEAASSAGGSRNKRILEIGCGSGRYLNELARRHPSWQLEGIEPGAGTATGNIRKGSAYAIPFTDRAFDGAFSFIALQHVSDIQRALSEAKRILKPGATFVICDRNPISARGLLKPWHELRGRWMYPWDSPFRERWYTVGRWKSLLRQAGFVSLSARVVNDPEARGIRRLIPTNRFLIITGRLPSEKEEQMALEPSWRPTLFTGRWWLEQGNRLLQPLNLRFDTLTAAGTEEERLRSVEAHGGFSKPIYPLPPCFSTADYRRVLDAVQNYRDRFNRFIHAEDNDVAFTFNNYYLSSPDAEVLYTMIRERRPARVLEIGCGNSTKVIRQAILDGKLRSTLTCIDPLPREEISALADVCVRARVETQDAAVLAESLQSGDLLFVDTSHEVRVANDLAFIFGCLIPQLRPGVIVHIHDIFLPYEYHPHWAFGLNLHNWGEQYIVQAMLTQSARWTALWPGHYLQRSLPDFGRYFPHCGERLSLSLWIEKTAA